MTKHTRLPSLQVLADSADQAAVFAELRPVVGAVARGINACVLSRERRPADRWLR
jgi:hypothetical protein